MHTHILLLIGAGVLSVVHIVFYWCFYGARHAPIPALLQNQNSIRRCSNLHPSVYNLHQLSTIVSLSLIGYLDLSYKPREKRNSIFSKCLSSHDLFA